MHRSRKIAAAAIVFAACSGPALQAAGPTSPASPKAANAPVPVIATSLVRNPLEDSVAQAPSPAKDHDHHGHGHNHRQHGGGQPKPPAQTDAGAGRGPDAGTPAPPHDHTHHGKHK